MRSDSLRQLEVLIAVSLMAYEDIGLLLFIALGLLGVVGGMPQIFRWIKPKAHLKIIKAEFSKFPDDNFRYQIHLEIENETKLLERNSDASNVTAEYFIIDKNGVQWASASNHSISLYFLAGTKILKDIEVRHSLMPDGNPYTVILRVTCNEGRPTKKKIAYEATSMIFA
jgi:hypothetical protein